VITPSTITAVNSRRWPTNLLILTSPFGITPSSSTSFVASMTFAHGGLDLAAAVVPDVHWGALWPPPRWDHHEGQARVSGTGPSCLRSSCPTTNILQPRRQQQLWQKANSSLCWWRQEVWCYWRWSSHPRCSVGCPGTAVKGPKWLDRGE
jgi:hypothetical protein